MKKGKRRRVSKLNFTVSKNYFYLGSTHSFKKKKKDELFLDIAAGI